MHRSGLYVGRMETGNYLISMCKGKDTDNFESADFATVINKVVSYATSDPHVFTPTWHFGRLSEAEEAAIRGLRKIVVQRARLEALVKKKENV